MVESSQDCCIFHHNFEAKITALPQNDWNVSRLFQIRSKLQDFHILAQIGVNLSTILRHFGSKLQDAPILPQDCCKS